MKSLFELKILKILKLLANVDNPYASNAVMPIMEDGNLVDQLAISSLILGPILMMSGTARNARLELRRMRDATI